MNDDLRFQHRAIDRPTTVLCPSCQRDVALPMTEPWLMIVGVAMPPVLASFFCPQCRTCIYLQPVREEERLRDADLDAIRGEDDE